MHPVHQFALEGKHTELKNLLQENSSTVDLNDSHGLKPLHHAAHGGSIECTQLLIVNGADVNAKNEQNITPIVCTQNIKIAEILIKHGAELNVVTKRGDTPLIRAISRKDKEMIRLLTAHGADVNHVVRLDFRETITQRALSTVRYGDSQEKKEEALEILKILLEAGADPNIQNVYGNTALHDASQTGLTEFVKLLLKHSADPCIRNIGKKSCFESAAEFPEILELLEPYRQNLKPTIEIQDSPEKLIERLLAIGFVNRSQFIPCSEAEIEDLETRNKVKLPESYKKFLRIMGKGAGNFLKSDGWEAFYPDFDGWLGTGFYNIPEAELDLCSQSEIDFSLSVPGNFFVFATRYGDYPLGFFADGIDDDPDIYLLEEESEMEFWGKTFWKFFQEMVEYYEFYCDSNRFSKTAVPWSANYKS